MEHWAKIDLKNGENLPEMNNPRFPGTNTNTFPSTQKKCKFRHFTDTKLIQSNCKLNYFTVFLLIM